MVIAPITLHTGVASLEAGEPPLPEWFTVPQPTADLVNLTRAAGRRVMAVGTTSTRALESAADAGGHGAGPQRAGPSLVLGPDHPARVVTGLITGWHDAGASHLALLEAVAGPALVGRPTRRPRRPGTCGTSSATAACCCLRRRWRRPASGARERAPAQARVAGPVAGSVGRRGGEAASA